jgi:hypothetical protein
MFKISTLLFIFLFSSCELLLKKEEAHSIFSSQLLKSFSFSSELTINKDLETKEVISRPVGTWLRLVRSEKFCLDYKVPTKKVDGVLSISKCESLPVKKAISQIEGIRNFKFSLSNNFKSNKKIRNANYGLNLSYEFYGANKKINVLAFNLLRKDHFDAITYKKYESHAEYRWKKGLRISSDETISTRSTPWVGSGDNDYLHGKINFCYRVDSSCKEIQENICDECLNGWIEIVDFKCPGGSSKVCAPLECGDKGMPACPRGTHWKGVQLSDMCFNDSPAGYCKKGLKTICDENKILTCI